MSRPVPEPELFPLPELHGRCGSAEAAASAHRLVAEVDAEARPLRIRAAEGLAPDGTASRWELTFDLPVRTGEADVVVTFVWEEASGRWGAGVGSVGVRPFPAPGSELEAMLVRGEIPRRRLSGLWRQQLAERRPLPPSMPTAAEALARVPGAAPGLRAMEASVSRTGGAAWRVSTRTGERIVRFEGTPRGRRLAG